MLGQAYWLLIAGLQSFSWDSEDKDMAAMLISRYSTIACNIHAKLFKILHQEDEEVNQSVHQGIFNGRGVGEGVWGMLPRKF